jgi:hypothetical protein
MLETRRPAQGLDREHESRPAMKSKLEEVYDTKSHLHPARDQIVVTGVGPALEFWMT